jgi:hypothetical protein
MVINFRNSRLFSGGCGNKKAQGVDSPLRWIVRLDRVLGSDWFHRRDETNVRTAYGTLSAGHLTGGF